MDITLLSWFQIILSVVLIGLVLLQNKGEDGLGGAFGGSGGGGNFHTRRGLEQTIFIITIIVGVLFFGTAIAILLLS
jgi:preprotein translocase subunit SecG